MRILYLADIRFPLERANGIQTMETCYGLGVRGHEVILRVRRDSHRPERDPFHFYGLPPLPALTIERSWTPGAATCRRGLYLACAAAGLIRHRPDVVLTRDLGVAALLLRLPCRRRPPIVYESHGFSPTVSAELPTLLSGAPAASPRKLVRLDHRERFVWMRADGYVTITALLLDELTRRFGPRSAAVVPDGVRLPADASAEQRPAHDAPVVGYAGHLYPWKGVETLLDALVLVPRVRGLIVGGHPGETDLPRLRQRADALGLADRVTFAGLVPPRDVHAWLTSADILVLPNTAATLSRHYSSPLKLFEYMAAGRPIVASDLPSFREILSAEEAVFVQPGSASALAEGLTRLLGDPAMACRMAGAAKDRAKEYSWDRRAERLESTLVAAARRHADRSAAE